MFNVRKIQVLHRAQNETNIKRRHVFGPCFKRKTSIRTLTKPLYGKKI